MHIYIFIEFVNFIEFCRNLHLYLMFVFVVFIKIHTKCSFHLFVGAHFKVHVLVNVNPPNLAYIVSF